MKLNMLLILALIPGLNNANAQERCRCQHQARTKKCAAINQRGSSDPACRNKRDGDFNMGSHLDWTEGTKATHYGLVVEWPESLEMLKAGFTDSYRKLHVNVYLIQC